MLGEEMIARLSEAVTRGRPSGPTIRTARHLSHDPAFPLQLKQLLPDRFAGELKFIRQMGDRGGSLPLQGGQNRASTRGQLINSNHGPAPGACS